MRLINRKPNRGAQVVLAVLPFAAVAGLYATTSAARLSANAGDKLLPGFASLADAVRRMAFVADPRSGAFLLWQDTLASLERLLSGLGIATATALILGMLMGMFPYVRAVLSPFVNAISMVPPLALLPILFIVTGLGEAAKITLIAIGVTPVMIREIAGRARELPREQIIKAETLGASSWQIGLRIVLPQVLPRLVEALRLALGAAWLFLIAAEAIAAEAGLGFRIFLVRRYLAMDVIIPYVAWITLLAAIMDLALWGLRKKIFPWFGEA